MIDSNSVNSTTLEYCY